MRWNTDEFNEQLEAAVEGFDRDEAAVLCDQLIAHLRERDDPYPPKASKIVLRILRGKRYFELMQAVANALIQNEQTDARVCREYAQSQLDQGNLTAAIVTLEKLERDTAPDGSDPNPQEHVEARGLLGRAYKDLYVLADNPNRSRNRRFLEKSISYYRKVYEGDKNQIWPGINSVALIRRAAVDGVELNEIAGPKALADSMATEILAKVKNRHFDEKADMWDFATAVEACIGLEEHADALKWLQRYLDSSYTDAFELGSTYRQLTQVWGLHPGAPPGDKILPPLKAALLEQQGSHLELSVKDVSDEQLEELEKDAGYEKVLGAEGFKSLKWFRKCMLRACAVAQVEDTNGNSVGTAFVVRGGDLKPKLGDELLLLTNAHVVSGDALVSRALRPSKAVLKFELWKDGNSPEFEVDELWSSPPDRLDATLLRPTPKIEKVEPMPVTEVLPVPDTKQRAYIIGHPQGRKLSFSIHDNYLLDHDNRLLHYRSPTEPGSSGSPVFNDDWELIGLHHRGLHRMPRLKGKEGTYAANEGIWIQAIIGGLAEANIS